MNGRVRPRAVAHIAALPASRPFIAPEEIARNHGFATLLRLGANESSFGPSPRAIESMQREAPLAALYGDPESVDLRDALALRLGLEPKQLVVGAGIDDLMGLAVRAFVGLGGSAVTTLGTYPTFTYHVTGYGGDLATVPYRDDGSIDVDGLIARCRERDAALLYLANPDNPSGSSLTPDAIDRVLREIPARTVLLLDEAYVEFDPVLADRALELSDRVVRLRTFSKAYGLAGMRIGYAMSGAATIEEFGKIRLQYGVSRLAQAGALAALHDEAFVHDVIAQTAEGREDYRALGERVSLPVLPSTTNFVLFDAGSRERAVRLLNALEERAVFVRKPGAPPLDRCVRVTVGTRAERAQFAAELAAVLQAEHAAAGLAPQ